MFYGPTTDTGQVEETELPQLTLQQLIERSSGGHVGGDGGGSMCVCVM